MPACQINSTAKLDALDIEDEIVEAIEDAGPGGLSYKRAADIVGLDYDRFYYVASQLSLLGRIKIERAQTGNEYRMILPHWDAPTLMLSPKQQQVFDLLCARMNSDKLIQISFGEITKRTGCGAPSFALERLDYKGCLQVVGSGGPTFANTYRVYPDRDGPRGLSEHWFKPSRWFE